MFGLILEPSVDLVQAEKDNQEDNLRVITSTFNCTKSRKTVLDQYNDDGYFALFWASRNGNENIVYHLSKYGADINKGLGGRKEYQVNTSPIASAYQCNESV